MAQKQYFGIKYPFTNNCIEKYEFDLNTSEKDKVLSELLHLIFTPKGERLRMPNYGTNLIKYIFEPNDSNTWSGVMQEIQDDVTTWIQNVKISYIDILASEDGRQINVRIDYSVTEGSYIYDNSVVVEI